ncbi:uncharacterized protein LOC107795064 [Nicotiana tabacum]|uniref:Dentin sialophosphoprotein n=1 Tax=Nicotiana tabacum TaxID=4097 RepID=A0A1S4A961_TOBAC|nr:PREDICTED: dentin sialophosphoprotein-like [Nicotiana tabacum]
MKKSNFLRSSKEMLTKSFNSAKCKTSLKLASSRLKLLKNKKEVAVKQMKREVAQLLDSGQDRTARIRVEHVVREEKMMAAYDLIEIYCELIVARLPIIESQKNCPIDLKEAITSVVFASPRCGDIPELLDVRKHFTAKYGKEFISAAVELRPDCGVSRMLVEKLSAKAPDGQTKIRILGSIAVEYGVQWDPKSVEEAESVPPNDLLNGSGSLQKAGNIHEDLLHSEASDVRTPLDHGKRPNASPNIPEQNARSSPRTQNFVSAHGGGRGIAPSSNYHHGVGPSGFRDEGMEAEQSFPADGNFSVGRQNWNMEFKDATSAAQAAAESAERASVAARAAAELSRFTRQYSSESQRSEVQSSGGRGPGMYDTSSHEQFHKDSATSSLPDRNPRFQNERIDSLQHEDLSRARRQFHDDNHGTSVVGEPGKYGTSSIHEHFPKDPVFSSSPDRNSRFQHERTDGLQHDNLARVTRHHNESHGTSDRPGSQVSSGSIGSINNDNSFSSLEEGDRYMQKSLSKEDSRDKMIMRKPSGRTESDSMSNFENDSTENVNYFGEKTTTKDPKINSSDSYLSTSDFGQNIPHSSHRSFGYDATSDPYTGVYQGHVPSETVNKNSHDSASVAFDDSGSEDDHIKFDSDPVYDDQQAKLYFPSPERKSPTYDSANKNLWSFHYDKSQEKSPLSSEISVEKHSPQLSENLVASGNNSRPENVVPTFDDSDGMNSESDSEMVRSPIGRSKDIQNISYEHAWNHDSPRSSYMENVSGTDGKKWSHSLSDKMVSGGVQRQVKGDKSDSLSSSEDEHKHKKSQDRKDDGSAPALPGTQTDDGSLASSVSGFEKELTFGKLTGGLKHKGHIPPPYIRSQLNNVPSSVEKAQESPALRSQAVAPPKSSVGVGVRMKRDEKSSSRLEGTHSDSDSDTDSSDEDFSQETSNYRQKTGRKVNTKHAALRGSTTYFDSDSSDSEVGPKEQSLAGRSQLGSGFSRRTKASSSSLDTNFSSKFKMSYEPAVNSDSGLDRKPSRNSFSAKVQEPQKPVMSSYVADTQVPQRLTKNFYRGEIHEAPSDKRKSSEQPSIRPTVSRPNSQPKITSQEGSRKSRVEQPSSSAQMAAASGSSDALKAPASSGDKFSRKDSMNKASHVHPKLPDYDDIAAKLQSLRMNPK